MCKLEKIVQQYHPTVRDLISFGSLLHKIPVILSAVIRVYQGIHNPRNYASADFVDDRHPNVLADGSSHFHVDIFFFSFSFRLPADVPVPVFTIEIQAAGFAVVPAEYSIKVSLSLIRCRI